LVVLAPTAVRSCARWLPSAVFHGWQRVTLRRASHIERRNGARRTAGSLLASLGMETRTNRARVEHIVACRAALAGVVLGLCIVGVGTAVMPRHEEAHTPAVVTCRAQPEYMCAPIRYPLPGEGEP
jgi:hypothetical protein